MLFRPIVRCLDRGSDGGMSAAEGDVVEVRLRFFPWEGGWWSLRWRPRGMRRLQSISKMISWSLGAMDGHVVAVKGESTLKTCLGPPFLEGVAVDAIAWYE